MMKEIAEKPQKQQYDIDGHFFAVDVRSELFSVQSGKARVLQDKVSVFE